jgi:hypothetical protein
MTKPDCASVPGQAQIRPRNILRNDHAAAAIRPPVSMRQERHSVRLIRFGQRAPSTLEIGRRIMSERRRTRTGRGRRYWVRGQPRTRADNGGEDDDALRAFVRVLARQAARECFEIELKQRPEKTQ